MHRPDLGIANPSREQQKKDTLQYPIDMTTL